MARVSNDVTTVREFLGPGLMDLCRSVMLFTAGLVIMLTIDVKLALLAALPLPFITLLFVWVDGIMERTFHAVQTQFGGLATFVQENFSGARVVKAYVQEDNEAAAFERETIEFEQANLEWARLSMALWPLLAVLVGLSTVIVIYVGALEVQAGAHHARRVRPVQRYIALLVDADGEPRLDAEHVPAGGGIDAARRGGARAQARRHRCAGRAAAARDCAAPSASSA